ncbi:hypothetical protein QFC22_002931 [Naganishia vaughanmartiniae]|uniref:Uncharacterized protein n=1 Tax=Naganishia vaughanmartiniae TaxID=1424756 RepID=A0ACC2X9E9_9TREE|nr:hypothetical protein QFC22_002931 [Naganishia vaughanmartiniae]
MSLEKTKSLVPPEPEAGVEALFERRVIGNRATGSKSWGVEPSKNLLSDVMLCSIAARNVMKALFEETDIHWQKRNTGDWMWNAVYYISRIGRLEGPKVTEIFDIRGTAPGRLSSIDIEGGAGAVSKMETPGNSIRIEL